jgi:hypothetical protein
LTLLRCSVIPLATPVSGAYSCVRVRAKALTLSFRAGRGGRHTMIDLAPVKAFACGRPYDGDNFLKCCRDLTDTVFRTHFKSYSWDDELYSVAMFGICKVIREKKVDLSRSAGAFFSYLYTTVRNFVGNHLKAEFRKGPANGHLFGGSEEELPREPQWKPSQSLERHPESTAIVRASVGMEARVVFERLRECGAQESRYARDVASAAVFRAVAFAR